MQIKMLLLTWKISQPSYTCLTEVSLISLIELICINDMYIILLAILEPNLISLYRSFVYVTLTLTFHLSAAEPDVYDQNREPNVSVVEHAAICSS